jgi:acyl carrier protein
VSGDGSRAFTAFTAMLAAVTGGDETWAARVTPATRLDTELHLDSLELVALGGLLRARYGGRADLPGYLAGLELDQLIELTVADVLAHLQASGALIENDR